MTFNTPVTGSGSTQAVAVPDFDAAINAAINAAGLTLTIPAARISDASAVGRAILQAIDAAAQRTALGMGTVLDDVAASVKFSAGDVLALGDPETGLFQELSNVFERGRKLNVGVAWTMSLAEGEAGLILWDDLTGLGIVIAEPNKPQTVSGAAAGALWSKAEYNHAEAQGLAEALRLNSQNVSGFAKRAVDASAALVLRIGTGQSFMAGSAQARPFLTTSRLALMGYSALPARTVGPDSRGVNSGPTFVTYGGGSLTLTPLSEKITGPTNTDLVYSAAQVAAGDYAVNARAATPETARELVAWLARNAFYGLPETAVPAWLTVVMNHAKTDGSAAEVFLGEGLSRLYSLIAVYIAATSGVRLCDLVDLNHGQEDEGLDTADYFARVIAYLDAIKAQLLSELGQTASPVMLQQQVGGPRYGSDSMVCANAQVDLMLDTAGTAAAVFLVGCSYEVPSLYFVNAGQFAGFPTDSRWDNNAHPTLAGNVLMGIRSGVALHYIQDRNEPYWVPFPFKVYYSGKRFLLSVPSKFPPLRAVEMVCGVETYLLDNLGITFESSAGAENPVTFARIVPGYKTLIEGECSADIAGFPVMKTGKRLPTNAVSGFTCVRDSFAHDPGFKLPFDVNQTVFPGMTKDNPALNGLGRYLENIRGWVGAPDLGNPCARRTITAEQMPSV